MERGPGERALLPLPEAPYDACEKQAGRVSSLSLVRYRTNDYSAPVAYGHRNVLVRGYVDRVVISAGPRSSPAITAPTSGMILCSTPSTTMPLLEQKTAALDQAAPLQGWDLPEEFATLRRLLESRTGRRGKREFVQVLRLFEHFSPGEVHAAVRGCPPVIAAVQLDQHALPWHPLPAHPVLGRAPSPRTAEPGVDQDCAVASSCPCRGPRVH